MNWVSAMVLVPVPAADHCVAICSVRAALVAKVTGIATLLAVEGTPAVALELPNVQHSQDADALGAAIAYNTNVSPKVQLVELAVGVMPPI